MSFDSLLRSFRRDADRAMIYVCDVTRAGPADAYGGTSSSGHLTDQRCWYQAAGGSEDIDEARTVALGDEILWFPIGTDITEDDQVTQIRDRRDRVVAEDLEIEHVADRTTHLECTVRTSR